MPSRQPASQGSLQSSYIEKPTAELCELVFAAAGTVQLTRGKLAREEAAGYIVADFLGVELIDTEALRLGESVRRAAGAITKAVTAKANAASAKASRMRTAAAKDAERARRHSP